jgi:hypothetical protein
MTTATKVIIGAIAVTGLLLLLRKPKIEPKKVIL